MGNKEFSVGTLSFREGTSLTKFPTVEDVREAFLLYHMTITPRAITHTPTDTNKAKISVGDSENGYFLSIFSRTLLKHFHQHGR